MISVVIPLYNKREQIENTLKSVFAQTFTDYEVIIVDDGSTDGSAELVTALCKTPASIDGDEDVASPNFPVDKIRLIRQENAGVSAARNRGIAEAQGEYIALLDADDEWKTDYLQTQADLIKQYPEASIFATNYEFHDTKGKTKPTILNKIKIKGANGILDNYFEIASCSHPPLWTSAVVVRKSEYEAIGGFPVGIKSGEDLLTWAKLVCKYAVAFNISSHAIYNLGEGYDFSNKPTRKQDNNDPVGKGLLSLYKNNPSIKSLKKYISLWHKMRASTAIRFGYKKEAVKESFLALKYNPMNYKVVPFIILSLTPSFLRNKLISLHK